MHGLEVSDGDINLNIDSHGRVLSWGNSFHAGAIPDINAETATTASAESSRSCEILRSVRDAHEAELEAAKGTTGAWGLVKSAAQVLLPGLIDATPEVNEHHLSKVKTNLVKAQQHYDALCDNPSSERQILYPVDALLHLLPRLQKESGLGSNLSADDFSSIPEHSFTPKPAPSEPPTETISGP